MDIMSLSPVELRVNEALGTKQTNENVNATMFDNILNSFTSMEKTQVDAKTQMADVLMGNSENSHGALIALQKAELQMSFASSVRDKVVSGVNQLFNMQI
ncbi:flagellar hook-basal body complex protein FliE [[Brevibacterium] frigoritolerans]|nr:flagellar hook-basal body complex protein FliE [Peribacillus frigoritolerans]